MRQTHTRARKSLDIMDLVDAEESADYDPIREKVLGLPSRPGVRRGVSGVLL